MDDIDGLFAAAPTAHRWVHGAQAASAAHAQRPRPEANPTACDGKGVAFGGFGIPVRLAGSRT